MRKKRKNSPARRTRSQRIAAALREAAGRAPDLEALRASTAAARLASRRRNPRRSPLKKLKDRLHAALVLGFDPRFKRRVTEGWARSDRGRKGKVIHDGWVRDQRERARIKAAARSLRKMRAANPTARWSRSTRARLRRAADRIALAAHGRWDVKRVPDFLRYWAPANRSAVSYAVRSLKDARRANPRRAARRRNPWPALANGFAAGLGLFAANQVTSAIRANGKKKRRKR